VDDPGFNTRYLQRAEIQPDRRALLCRHVQSVPAEEAKIFVLAQCAPADYIETKRDMSAT
jgi:hypothetical protein